MRLGKSLLVGAIFIFTMAFSVYPEIFNSPFTAVWEMGVAYDDNILHYSSRDIDDFLNNRRSYRYAIQTYDDLITNLSVAVYWRSGTTQYNRRLRIKYAQQLYTINPIKDHQTISIHLRAVLDRNQIQFGYSYIPRFYIRHLPELDIEPDGHRFYKPCEFEKHQISVKLSRDLLPYLCSELWYRYGIYDYNPDFNEYDTKAQSFQLVLCGQFDPFHMNIGYSYKFSRAKGYDEEGESKNTSDDPDISYNQHWVGSELAIDLTPSTTIALECNYGRKHFTTQKSFIEDPYHFDRKDWHLRISPSIEMGLSQNLRLHLGYTYLRREVESPAKQEIEEVKDFTNNRFGIRLVGRTRF